MADGVMEKIEGNGEGVRGVRETRVSPGSGRPLIDTEGGGVHRVCPRRRTASQAPPSCLEHGGRRRLHVRSNRYPADSLVGW
jgi:hypothetical protein